MTTDAPTFHARSAVAALRRFSKPRPAVERCELCSAPLHGGHEHLVEPEKRRLLCACEACAILFSGSATMKYRRVPRRVRFLPDFRLTDAQWDSLAIPIGLAFFIRGSSAGRVAAIYPSPAGPTEAWPDSETWADVAADNPELIRLEADTEALLVNRVHRAREHYVVPIDECYKLVGLIRMNWRGLSGGDAVWVEIGQFFSALKVRADVQVGARTGATRSTDSALLEPISMRPIC